MPCLDDLFIEKIFSKHGKRFPIFVETGTLHGETIRKMEKHFDQLHTIEIKPEYRDAASKAYKGDKIKFWLGDSALTMPTVVSELDNNTIFFLDGHWSCGDTGRGPKDCPLYEELTSINEEFKHEAIIIIDDVRLFGLGPKSGSPTDWTEINKENVRKLVENRIISSYSLPSVYHHEDRLIYHLRAL
jgi:hypothetical protein